jgi:eukaryotic-like serine/threonine-protein kinase
MHEVVADKQAWEFVEGHEIAPGRTVLKPLGGGHDYEVYLVWDDHLFSIMVAKLLRPDRFDDPKALRSLEREAAALDRLAHPTLLRGFGAVLDGPFPHVLVEHLEGPSLRRLIRRDGPLSLQQVLPLALSVASAVHYMHAEGYVHLDVKPDNIVVGVPPRLIDFSLVRSLRRARRIKGWIGTRAYMPPEQCAPGEAGEIGPWSDVWGLGATLYHAVSGKRPFSRGSSDIGLSREERFPQLVEDVRPWPVRVPPELSQAVLACLRRNTDERPSAAELALSLEPLVAALPAKLRLSRGGRIQA